MNTKAALTTCLPSKVKQEWSISTDRGKNWQTTFLGIYDKH
jgi:hypothetical protein